jgi:hypothetical protein
MEWWGKRRSGRWDGGTGREMDRKEGKEMMSADQVVKDRTGKNENR